jgi:hypothetical protein
MQSQPLAPAYEDPMSVEEPVSTAEYSHLNPLPSHRSQTGDCICSTVDSDWRLERLHIRYIEVAHLVSTYLGLHTAVTGYPFVCS